MHQRILLAVFQLDRDHLAEPPDDDLLVHFFREVLPCCTTLRLTHTLRRIQLLFVHGFDLRPAVLVLADSECSDDLSIVERLRFEIDDRLVIPDLFVELVPFPDEPCIDLIHRTHCVLLNQLLHPLVVDLEPQIIAVRDQVAFLVEEIESQISTLQKPRNKLRLRIFCQILIVLNKRHSILHEPRFVEVRRQRL